MGKEKVDAIVFVAKFESEEYETYKLDSENSFSDDKELSKSSYFKHYKYYLDQDAKKLVLVFDPSRSPEKPSGESEESKVKQEFEGIKEEVESVIKNFFEDDKAFESSGEVVFLRHFGKGISLDRIYIGELRLQGWAKKWGGFGRWHFFLISSVRPDLLNVNTCLIPTGNELKKFIADLRSGSFNVRPLQDESCAAILERWKEARYQTTWNVVLFVGIEFEGLGGSKLGKSIKLLPDDEAFNEPSHLRFVITQNGVRYSNWWGWHGETSVVQVLQNLRQSGEVTGEDRVFVCQVNDEMVNGFAQVANKTFPDDVNYDKIYLTGVLSGNRGIGDEKTARRIENAMCELKGGEFDPADWDEKACESRYSQIMRELGH